MPAPIPTSLFIAERKKDGVSVEFDRHRVLRPVVE